ncbi:MAG: sugar phosphate isomerase/epimerase [Tannerella sp.]|jgi:sugar phosphate isomerase/epimerase|nr:sugar phosphate isomerase/epimerase [Tannerella sp.]
MTTRRNFFRSLATGAAAIAVAPAGTAAAMTVAPPVNREAFKPLRISMLSYSFHGLVGAGMMDIFHFLETCKYRYGLDAADLWNGMITSTDDGFIDRVHTALEDRQLVVPNIAVDGTTIMQVEGEDPAANRAMQDRYMQIARRWGVGFVRFDAGPRMLNGRKDIDGWTEREFDFIVTRYRELAQFAGDNGFKVGAEVHWGPERCWVHMEKLIKAVAHPGFAICMHFGGWYGSREEVLAAEKAAAPYVAHTHIPWNVCEDPALHERLAVLRNAGYTGYYSVEHHSGKNEYNMVEAQLGKVRAVLTGWNRGEDGNIHA